MTSRARTVAIGAEALPASNGSHRVVVVANMVTIVVVLDLLEDHGNREGVTKMEIIVVADLPGGNGSQKAKEALPASSIGHRVVAITVIIAGAALLAGNGSHRVVVAKTVTTVVVVVVALAGSRGIREVVTKMKIIVVADLPENNGNQEAKVALPASSGNHRVVTIVVETVPVLPGSNGNHGANKVDSKADVNHMTATSQKVRAKGNGEMIIMGTNHVVDPAILSSNKNNNNNDLVRIWMRCLLRNRKS